MSRATYFIQQCPTCGRTLQIRVEYLGKMMVCQHCRGEFDACDPAGSPAKVSDSGTILLERADQLLAGLVPDR